MEPEISTRPMAMRSTAPTRNFFVDLLRGLSILIVMCMHVGGLPPWADAFAPEGLRVAIGSGYYGVTVFFVISGYLIASTSLKRFGSLGEIDIRTFATFRFGRIVPFLVLVLVLLITLGLSGANGFVFPRAGGAKVADATASVLSLQFNDWFVNHIDAGAESWTVMWSLSIEELFYVFFPIVCRTLRAKTMMIAWLLFALPFCFYVRSQNANALYFFSGCVDAISIGVLTAILAEEWRGREHVVFSVLGMSAALAAMFYICQLMPPRLNVTWGPLLCAAAAGVFIYASLLFPQRWLGGDRRSSRMRLLGKALGLPLILVSFLGRSSYETYLLHVPAYRFATTYVSSHLDKALFFVLIGMLAYFLNVHFTERVNRLIREGRLRTLPAPARWKKVGVPVLVALALVAIPNLVVSRSRAWPSSVASVSATINRAELRNVTVPLVVFGEHGDADFVSIKRAPDGSVQLQSDHWGSPSVVKSVKPELVKDNFTVVVDVRSPAVLVGGVTVFDRTDLGGFTSHDEVAIGRNDIGGGTMEATVAKELASSVITFNNGVTSTDRYWRRGEWKKPAP